MHPTCAHSDASAPTPHQPSCEAIDHARNVATRAHAPRRRARVGRVVVCPPRRRAPPAPPRTELGESALAHRNASSNRSPSPATIRSTRRHKTSRNHAVTTPTHAHAPHRQCATLAVHHCTRQRTLPTHNDSRDHTTPHHTPHRPHDTARQTDHRVAAPQRPGHARVASQHATCISACTSRRA